MKDFEPYVIPWHHFSEANAEDGVKMESGMEYLICDSEDVVSGKSVAYYNIAKWFDAGDKITLDMAEGSTKKDNETAEKRLLRTIFGDTKEHIIDKSGFYQITGDYGPDSKFPDCITIPVFMGDDIYFSFLPLPPNNAIHPHVWNEMETFRKKEAEKLNRENELEIFKDLPNAICKFFDLNAEDYQKAAEDIKFFDHKSIMVQGCTYNVDPFMFKKSVALTISMINLLPKLREAMPYDKFKESDKHKYDTIDRIITNNDMFGYCNTGYKYKYMKLAHTILIASYLVCDDNEGKSFKDLMRFAVRKRLFRREDELRYKIQKTDVLRSITYYSSLRIPTLKKLGVPAIIALNELFMAAKNMYALLVDQPEKYDEESFIKSHCYDFEGNFIEPEPVEQAFPKDLPEQDEEGQFIPYQEDKLEDGVICFTNVFTGDKAYYNFDSESEEYTRLPDYKE